MMAKRILPKKKKKNEKGDNCAHQKTTMSLTSISRPVLGLE